MNDAPIKTYPSLGGCRVARRVRRQRGVPAEPPTGRSVAALSRFSAAASARLAPLWSRRRCSTNKQTRHKKSASGVIWLCFLLAFRESRLVSQSRARYAHGVCSFAASLLFVNAALAHIHSHRLGTLGASDLHVSLGLLSLRPRFHLRKAADGQLLESGHCREHSNPAYLPNKEICYLK